METKEKSETELLILNYIGSQTYQKEFKDIMVEMLDKYGVEMFNTSGIGEQLDINKAIKKIVNSSSTAGGSIDGNANVGSITAGGLMQEINKPHLLIHSYYRIWKWLKKNRGLDVANTFVEKQINGAIYMNDMHYIVGCISYCYNHSVMTIINQGLLGIDSKGDALPPKHLRSYFDQIEAYLLIAGSNTAGATGISGLLVGASIFMDKILKTGMDGHTPIGDPWQYLKEELGSLVYRLNQPARHSQSLFTNVSIYDDYFLEDLLPDYFAIIDGEVYRATMENVKKIQQIYLDVMREEGKRRVLTFPVTTACFSIEKQDNETLIKDYDFLNQICEANIDTAYINIFAGETSVLSSCCFGGDQEVLVKDTKNGVRLISLKELHEQPAREKPNLKVFNNGFWSFTKTIMIPKRDKKMYKITTAKNQEVICTNDHILLTDNGEKRADEVTLDDYLVVNNQSLYKTSEKDLCLTYEDGVLIGAYLGDGTLDKGNSNQLTLSLNSKKLEKLLPILEPVFKKYDENINIRIRPQENNVVFLQVSNKDIKSFIETWCETEVANMKDLNLECLQQSEDFRKGILYGLHATDGHSKYNIIYTSSQKLRKSIECLVVSLGGFCNISLDDRVDEPVIIRNKEYKRNNPVYHIRYLFNSNKNKSILDTLKVQHNCLYIKVKDIEVLPDNSDEYVYCLEMRDEEDHYFTLPNGIHLSNCRLQSDKSNKFFNSLGGASDAIGSFGVVSINLPRIAYNNKGNMDGFLKELEELSYLAQECNYAKRCLLKNTIAKGHAPLYSNGYMSLKNQFSTLGFVGLYEACEIMGYDITKYDGMEVGKEILNKMSQVIENVQEKYKIACNLEGVPAEGLAPKLAKKDAILGLNNEYKLYANQFIPLHKRCNMLNRIQLQAEYDKYCSGGSILHLNVDQKIDKDKMANIIEAVIKSGTKYFALNYNIYQCNECKGITVGTTTKCEHCGSEDIDRFLRVVGFITKVKDWVPSRIEEDRQFYKV